MPGYGLLPADKGSGLLPWSWALERLRNSRNYWLTSVWPDGRPHLMPVWAVWQDRDGESTGEAGHTPPGTLWFSSGLKSRKVRNIQAGSDVSVAAEDALNPVVLEGTVRIETENASLLRFLDAVNAKYETSYGPELVDPAANATLEITPRWVFGLTEDDFSGSPTRWTWHDGRS
ncbi:pyridoxamine 5'-phosphate oxidase family protein [Actinocrispum sp. NPDC049592]|uniref:pyridoxamine 5'-phosphate oxidase family protein n=1 Tax=Actinocrispum sp. NPDC049592 TaxID=3154835 RepID=UPI0034246E5B